MIGMVLVTHGRLADEFISATEHVVGGQDGMRAVCIEADDDMDQRRNEIKAAIDAIETGDGVGLLTDMFGGTPSNLAISLLQKGRVEVLAGINLPMLIKLASIRSSVGLEEAVEAAREAGVKYINVASQVLASS